jgi:predicted dithiol-disulfide oxidoreductase (DUF899 family)
VTRGAFARRTAPTVTAKTVDRRGAAIEHRRPMHAFRFPGESESYRRAREELLRAEIELRRRTEEVAAMRRELPLGGEVPTDYVFVGADGPTKMSELFGEKDTLVLYNFMYGPKMAKPCPMCTSFIDGLAGNAVHIQQRVALAIVAKSPLARIREFAATRAWAPLRLLSSAENTFNRDYHGDDEGGDQNPLLHVFVRRNGKTHHSWTSELLFVPAEPNQNQRHLDTMWPLWNVLDCTPAGRGTEWFPKLSY